jgi:LacI family transcriptional regulator
MSEKVTLKFLSEKCGISTTIISKILNNKEVRVSQEKKDMIIELAKKYNYVPNLTAASLVTKKSKMIGLLLPDISNAFFSEIAKNIEANLSKEGYNLIFCNTNDSYELQETYANLLLGRGVDALIFCLARDVGDKPKFVDRFLQHNIPLVGFDRFNISDKYSTVETNNKKGVYEGTDYLIKNGHTKIGCIVGPVTSSSTLNRLEGFKIALSDNNLEFISDNVAYGDYQFEGGYKACLELLKKDITAIIAFNDLMAYGAYKAIYDSGLNVPDDISVVGYDDLMFSQMLSVPLTSIAQNTQELSLIVSNLVLDAIKGIETKSHVSVLPNLIIRNSVKKI